MIDNNRVMIQEMRKNTKMLRTAFTIVALASFVLGIFVSEHIGWAIFLMLLTGGVVAAFCWFVMFTNLFLIGIRKFCNESNSPESMMNRVERVWLDGVKISANLRIDSEYLVWCTGLRSAVILLKDIERMRPRYSNSNIRRGDRYADIEIFFKNGNNRSLSIGNVMVQGMFGKEALRVNRAFEVIENVLSEHFDKHNIELVFEGRNYRRRLIFEKHMRGETLENEEETKLTKSEKSILKWVIISIASFLVIGLAVVGIGEIANPLGPEQSFYVEVIGTRRRIQDGYSQNTNNRYRFFINFRFYDGTEEEYMVRYADYNSVQEGDTGILTFRQRENINSERPRRGVFQGFELTPLETD